MEIEMVHHKDKELEVALELFNAELEKQKLEAKEISVIRNAENKKAEAVKALQEAENNPNLSSEEKEAAKTNWLKADDDLKRIRAGEEPASEDTEEPQAEEETKAEEPASEDTEEPQAEEETKAEEPASEDTEEPQAEEETKAEEPAS